MVKPNGLQINWQNSLAKNLVWAVAPGSDTSVDFVSKKNGTVITSGTWNGSSIMGKALSSTSTTNGGGYWPFTTNLTTIGSYFSIVMFAKLDTLAAFSHLLCVPYGATWSAPYASIHWFRNNTTNNQDISWVPDGSNFDACVSSATDFPSDGKFHMLGVSCSGISGRSARFFQDGLLTGTGTTATGTGTVDFGGKREVILFNHNSADNGEGIIGQVPYCVIFNKQLTDDEMRRIYTNPWQIYKYPGFSQSLNTVSAVTTIPASTFMMMGV